MVVKDRKITGRNRWSTMLSQADHRQLHKLSLLVMQEIARWSRPREKAAGGRTARLRGHGRHADAPQCTQAAAAAHFHCSQPTVSRAGPAAPGHRRCSPHMSSISSKCSREGTALVDERLPGMDWSAIRPVLREGKVHGMNVQIACNLKATWPLSPVPVHAHAHAYASRPPPQEILASHSLRDTRRPPTSVTIIVPFKRLSSSFYSA